MNALAWGLPAAWLVTLALHSAVLLLGAWTLCRLWRRLPDGTRETLWRVAAFGALATATLQTAVVREPLGGHLAAVPAEAASTAPAGAGAGGLAAEPLPPPLDFAVPEAAPPAVAAGSVPRSAPWPAMLAGGAVLIGLLAVLRLLSQRVRLGLLLAGRRPLADEAVHERVGRWQRSAGMRRVRLSTSDALTTPVAFGILRPEICLPERAADLDPAQRHAIVAHELAHLRRRDPFWLGLSALLRALFWWQPLYRVAHARLQALAEFRSDALALRWTGRGPLAGALVEVAAWLRPAPAVPVGLPAMAARPSVLRARVERILAGGGQAATERPLLVMSATALALAGLTAALPGARWQDVPAVPGSNPDMAVRDVGPGPGTGDGIENGTGSPLGELMAAYDRERGLLAEEFRALGDDLAGLPADHELLALMARLEERVARLDRTRKALGAFLAALDEDDRERKPRSRGGR